MAAETCLILGDLGGYRAISTRLKTPAFAGGLKIRPVLAQVLEGVDCLAHGDRAGAHSAFREAIEEAEQEVSPQERPLVPFAHDFYGAALQAMGEERKSAEEERVAREFCLKFGLKGRIIARAKFTEGLHRSLQKLFTSSLDRVGGV